MKYFILNQISEFLNVNCYKITNISRLDDLCVGLCFASKNYGNFTLNFDMNKNNSSIYLAQKGKKEYKAPFDIMLKKRFLNAKILRVYTKPNDRILVLETSLQGSYKELKSKLYFEFTGRFTNVIITDFDDIILSALHLYKNSKRDIEINKPLPSLEAREINEANLTKIDDFMEYFKAQSEQISSQKLANLKQNKIASVDKKIANIDALMANLPSQDALNDESSELYAKATALKSHLYEIKDYERDFSLDGLNFSIQKPAKIAADEMFKAAKKLRQKAANINKEKENLLEKKSFLMGLKEALILEQNSANIEVLAPKKSAKIKEKSNDLVTHFYKGDFKISIGKNERGNAWLLENSKKDDFWFHIQGYKGAHAIIKTNKQSLNDEIIAFTSRMCVLFSGHKSGSFQVDFTKRANLKVVSGAFVNYVNYNTVGVKI